MSELVCRSAGLRQRSLRQAPTAFSQGVEAGSARQYGAGCVVVPGRAMGKYRGLAAVEQPVADALVLAGVLERFGPSACPCQRPGAVGEQD